MSIDAFTETNFDNAAKNPAEKRAFDSQLNWLHIHGMQGHEASAGNAQPNTAEPYLPSVFLANLSTELQPLQAELQQLSSELTGGGDAASTTNSGAEAWSGLAQSLKTTDIALNNLDQTINTFISSVATVPLAGAPPESTAPANDTTPTESTAPANTTTPPESTPPANSTTPPESTGNGQTSVNLGNMLDLGSGSTIDPSQLGANVNGGWTANFDNAAASQSVLNQYFPVQWGGDTVNADGSVSISATPGEANVAQSGFMQTDNGASAGSGYGVYTITAAFNSQGGDGGAKDGNGSGDYIALWQSTNIWPGNTNGNSTTTGQEIDGWENYGNNQIATVHWGGANDTNNYQSYPISGIDATQENTYTLVWEPNAQGVPTLTEYVNACGVGAAPLQQVYSTSSNIGPDFAHGGANESFGIGSESAEPDGTAGSTATVFGASFTPYATTTGG